MSGTHTVVMGDRGRLVVPAEVRERSGFAPGTPLVLLETPNGLVLLTRDQLRARVRDELAGVDLVGDLLAERRKAAADEGRGVTSVLDASALIAFAKGEPGNDAVESALERGAVCGAANWSEVAQKVRAADRDWVLVRALIQSYDLGVEPVTADDAEWAAQRWARGEGLSLADRLCLALGERLDAEILTADSTWGAAGRITQIR